MSFQTANYRSKARYVLREKIRFKLRTFGYLALCFVNCTRSGTVRFSNRYTIFNVFWIAGFEKISISVTF